MTSGDMRFSSGHKTVTTAGTREALVTGKPDNMRVLSVWIQALSTNTDLAYVGDSGVSSANGHELQAGQGIALVLNPEQYKNGQRINMADIWLDVAVGGEGVCYSYTYE